MHFFAARLALRSLVGMLFLGSTSLWAAAVPPVGERLYCGEGAQALRSPLAIRDRQSRPKPGERCFQDPGFLRAERSAKASAPSKPAAPAEALAEPASPGSELSLAPLHVQGRLRQPRLPWTREPTAMERVDEDLPAVFVDRIFHGIPDL